MHLVVDYFALRAKEFPYVLRFAREYNAQGSDQRPTTNDTTRVMTSSSCGLT